MIKAILPLLFLLILLPPLQAVDTTPYEDLMREIRQEEKALDSATSKNDLDAMIEHGRKLDRLRLKLSLEDMLYLRGYLLIQRAYSESLRLLSSAETIYPEAAEDLKGDLDALQSEISLSEDAYERGAHMRALEILEGQKTRMYTFPNLIISKVDSLMEEESEAADKEASAVFDSALGRLDSSAALYAEAKTRLDKNNKEGAKESYDEAFILFGEAKDLTQMARAGGIRINEELRILLVALPLALIILLFLFFSVKIKRTALKTKISSKKLKAGEGAVIEREIILQNGSDEDMETVIKDSPPKVMKSDAFSIPPSEKKEKRLIWRLKIKAKEKLRISYKLTVPPLDSGWYLKFPGAKATYKLSSGMKGKLHSETNKIDIV